MAPLRKRTAPRQSSRFAAAERRENDAALGAGKTTTTPTTKTETLKNYKPTTPTRGVENRSNGNFGELSAIGGSKVLFTGKVLSRVRWLEEGSIAVAGTGEGTPAEDLLYVFEDVGDGIRLKQECLHPGKVLDLEFCIAGTQSFLVASSDGVVRCFSPSESKLERIGGFPAGEAAAAVAPLSERTALGAGSEATLVVMDIESGAPMMERTGSESIGIRAVSRLSSDDFVSAGVSGYVSVWDCRRGLQTPTQRLRYPMSSASLLCVDADEAQTHYVFSGTDKGEVVCWDRRKEDFPVSRTAPHQGHVWDLRIMTARPGMLISCGEDGSVLAWDFLTAAQRGIGTDEYWTAEISANELQELAYGRTLGVNSVDIHPRGDLVAYVTDSSTVTFTSFSEVASEMHNSAS